MQHTTDAEHSAIWPDIMIPTTAVQCTHMPVAEEWTPAAVCCDHQQWDKCSALTRKTGTPNTLLAPTTITSDRTKDMTRFTHR